MSIVVKRVYEPPDAADGVRVLVDRLWPRGLSKERARIDHWIKEVAPSNELRKWYGHDHAKWPEFKKRYYAELDGNADAVAALKTVLPKGRATFLYSSREEKLNNAHALVEYLGR